MKKLPVQTGSLSLLTILVALGLVGCSEIDGGDIENTIDLPVDSELVLHCEEVGLFENDCILEDPANPYTLVNVSEETKFDLNDGAPSAKSRYYLWATMQARNPSGENQYYVAVSLHEVYSESADPLIREHTKKAYRSVLDNYFTSATFFLVPLTVRDVTFPAPLKDIAGQNLYQPEATNLVSLYIDPVFALEEMGEWGYIFNTTTGITTKF